MASAYLSKSQGAGNKEKFTYSVWVKKTFRNSRMCFIKCLFKFNLLF